MSSSEKILFIQFEFDGDGFEFEQDARQLARPVSNVPGLAWKIWLSSPASGTFGGVYLFENERALNSFVDGPIAAQINGRPGYRNVEMKSFDVLAAPSLLTRAPLALKPANISDG